MAVQAHDQLRAGPLEQVRCSAGARDAFHQCAEACQLFACRARPSSNSLLFLSDVIGSLARRDEELAAAAWRLVQWTLIRIVCAQNGDVWTFADNAAVAKAWSCNAGRDGLQRACLAETRLQPRRTCLDERARQARDIAVAEYWSARLSPGRVSRRLGLSVSHFGRVFASHVGCGYTDFIKLARVRVGVLVLAHADCPIQEAARAVGYAYPSSFNRDVVDIVGAAPGVIKKIATLPASAYLSQRRSTHA